MNKFHLLTHRVVYITDTIHIVRTVQVNLKPSTSPTKIIAIVASKDHNNKFNTE